MTPKSSRLAKKIEEQLVEPHQCLALQDNAKNAL